MYTTSNLVLYIEGDNEYSNNVRSAIIDCNIPFKEIKPPTPIIPSIKVLQNITIIQINSKSFLQSLEQQIKYCHNFQSRVCVVYSSPELIDYFFDNYCLANEIDVIKQFIATHSLLVNVKQPIKTSTLLRKLVTAELENIGIQKKYIGFNYLVDISINSFGKNFYAKDYIDLFDCVAYSNSIKVDTIEKSVRHMLTKTWQDNEQFRQTLLTYNKIQKPNSKTILITLLTHLKRVI